ANLEDGAIRFIPIDEGVHLVLGTIAHRSILVHDEGRAALSETDLAKEDSARRVELDCDRDEDAQGGEGHEQESARHDVDEPFDDLVPALEGRLSDPEYRDPAHGFQVEVAEPQVEEIRHQAKGDTIPPAMLQDPER